LMRQLASGQVSEVPGDKKDENLHSSAVVAVPGGGLVPSSPAGPVQLRRWCG